jgi:hypothetical protein
MSAALKNRRGRAFRAALSAAAVIHLTTIPIRKEVVDR